MTHFYHHNCRNKMFLRDRLRQRRRDPCGAASAARGITFKTEVFLGIFKGRSFLKESPLNRFSLHPCDDAAGETRDTLQGERVGASDKCAVRCQRA